MEKIKKGAGWDADESLLSMIAPYDKFLNEKFNLNLKYESHVTFALHELLGISTIQLKKVEREFYESPYYDEVAPKDGIKEVIEYLSKELEMDVITGRSECDERYLLQTLDKFFKPHHFQEKFHLGSSDDYTMLMPKW